MKEKIIEIVAQFLRVPESQIGSATRIDRQALKSSIMVHRMYARIFEDGIKVLDYSDIEDFGTLMSRLGNEHNESGVELSHENKTNLSSFDSMNDLDNMEVGIDVEDIGSLPRVADFREDNFYKDNFSPEEISHCILQQDPYPSFAGLWAVKEAIVKADNQLRKVKLREINIAHNPSGKPLFPGFTLSISHSNSLAIAVAVKIGEKQEPAIFHGNINAPVVTKKGRFNLISTLTLLIAIVALIVALTK